MDTRFRFFLIVFIGLFVAAAWTFPRWWPLVNQESVVADAFPGLATDAQADFVSLPEAQKNQYLRLYYGSEDDEIEPQPEFALALVEARLLSDDRLAPGADQVFEPPAGARVIATGEFSGVDAVRQAQGELTIYELPDLSRIMRFGDSFSTIRLPGIHVILTRNPDPTDERGVGVDYLDMGELQGNIGGQTYRVPESADFARYPILALYHPEYDGVVAIAPIR